MFVFAIIRRYDHGFIVETLPFMLFMVYTPFLLFGYNQPTTLVPNQENV
jgi:hypothetical protein